MQEKKLDELSLQEWVAAMRATPEAVAEGVAIDYIFAAEKRRHELGLSYAELARRMGVSRAYMSKLMSGTQNSTLGSLVKLALVLGCEVKLSLKVSSKRKTAVTPVTETAVRQKAAKSSSKKPTPATRKSAAKPKPAPPAGKPARKPAVKAAAKSRKPSRV